LTVAHQLDEFVHILLMLLTLDLEIPGKRVEQVGLCTGPSLKLRHGREMLKLPDSVQ
jgi:hypothetical protein